MSIKNEITLYGRIKITGTIELKTGLHIGKGNDAITIGGLDNAIMRDPRTNQPYIPGSSFKGKLRSLAERREPGLNMETQVGNGVFIHTCEKVDDPKKVCPVCRIFGMPGQTKAATPARLLVRDVFLTPESSEELNNLDTDLPYAELKYEASIDRITAKANPRPVERVPAGAEFGDFELVFSVFESEDINLLGKVFEYMRLLEDDYLGGSGSRGYGDIVFKDLAIEIIPIEAYADGTRMFTKITKPTLIDLQKVQEDILTSINSEIQIKEPSDA